VAVDAHLGTGHMTLLRSGRAATNCLLRSRKDKTSRKDDICSENSDSVDPSESATAVVLFTRRANSSRGKTMHLDLPVCQHAEDINEVMCNRAHLEG
jgi:translation elongation factor EF-1alpha